MKRRLWILRYFFGLWLEDDEFWGLTSIATAFIGAFLGSLFVWNTQIAPQYIFATWLDIIYETLAICAAYVLLNVLARIADRHFHSRTATIRLTAILFLLGLLFLGYGTIQYGIPCNFAIESNCTYGFRFYIFVGPFSLLILAGFGFSGWTEPVQAHTPSS
jgi:hypothetical protein